MTLRSWYMGQNVMTIILFIIKAYKISLEFYFLKNLWKSKMVEKLWLFLKKTENFDLKTSQHIDYWLLIYLQCVCLVKYSLKYKWQITKKSPKSNT